MPDVLSIQLGGGSVVQKNVSVLSVGIIFLAKILISNHLFCEQPYKIIFIGHFHTTGLGRCVKLRAKVCKRTQQFPKLLGQQCWELLRPCWQWYANGSNNSRQCWDLQCFVGRIRSIRLWRPCVMRVRGPNNVENLFKWIQHCCAELRRSRNKGNVGTLLAQNIDRFQTLRNNSQQHKTTCNRVCKRTQ